MVKNLLSLISSRQSSILSGATILMVTVFASKFLGLIRNRLLVHNFDTSEASIFLAAFSLPDLLFQIIIFGALSVAFIPVFTDFLSNKGESEAFKFASNILSLALLIFIIFVILAFTFTGILNSLLIPGFTGDQKQITDQLTRIILLGQILLVIGAFFAAIAQSYQRFIVSSLAPIFYNIGIIFGIIFLTPAFGIMGAGLGVVIGAALHILIQLPLINSLGFKFSFSLDLENSGVKEIARLMSIRNIGLIFEQIAERVAIALASLISYSSVTLFTFATQLFTVPVSLFGATIAQAALPVLSREQSKSETESFKLTFLTSMHQILFLTLPAVAILIVLRIPVVRLTFGASQFSWEDTLLTGRAVAVLAMSLAAQAVIMLLVRGFYALKDTKTPVLVSIITVIINISLSLVFIKIYRMNVWGLALAYAITTNLSFLLLLYFLSKKVGGFNNRSLFMPALKMTFAAVVSAVVLYLPIKALDQLVFDTTKTVNLIILTGIASVLGMSIYLILVWKMGIKEVTTFAELIKKIYKMQFVRPKSDEVLESS